MILPETDGSYSAACNREGCSFTFGVASEDLARMMDTQHAEGHIERDLLADSIARAGALEPRAALAGHVHGAQCTQESCPGARYTCRSPRCVVEDGDGRYRIACEGHDVPSRSSLVRGGRRRPEEVPVAPGSRRPRHSQ